MIINLKKCKLNSEFYKWKHISSKNWNYLGLTFSYKKEKKKSIEVDDYRYQRSIEYCVHQRPILISGSSSCVVNRYGKFLRGSTVRGTMIYRKNTTHDSNETDDNDGKLWQPDAQIRPIW